MEKIYVIDALNWLFRSYYAIGPMTNPQGFSTNALFGFIRSLLKLVKDFSCDHLVAVFDGPDNTRERSALYEGYKSLRKEMPGDLFSQIEKAMEFCTIAGIPFLYVEGVEADDVMGSIALWAEKKKAAVYLCTSDKDLCQCVSDQTFLLNTHKENLLIDRKKVVELFGVPPEKMVDLLAIMGDASDNIPGLEGFGPKTAAHLLNELGTLEEILAHPEKVSGKKKQEVIANGREIALLSKNLATIRTDVDIPKETLFYLLKEPDLIKLKEFYQEMHFMSLLKEIDAKHFSAAPPEKVSYHLVDTKEELASLVDRLLKEEEICIDTETTQLKPMEAHLVGIGFAIHPKTAWYVPVNGNIGLATVLEYLAPLFESEKIAFYGHNLKYDLHVLLNHGIEIKKISFDTMLASYLLNPQSQRHNLDHLALEKFGKVKIPISDLISKGKNEISMTEVPIEKVADYCCEDVDYTCRLKILFVKELEERKLTSILENIELPLIPVLLKMEREGIYVDVKKLEHLSQELKERISSLEKSIFHLAEAEFNLNSPKQLGEVLFQKLMIKSPRAGHSTSADILELLKNEHPIIPQILEYRTLEKLRSTYADALPEQVFEKTGRIHCTFNQSVAATGRLSCQNPNLQNIPVRSVEGLKIREAFKPEKQHYHYLAADYSQIELRLLAHLSEDPLLVKAFREGEDIHSVTASHVFNVPLPDVTKEMRQLAKAVNFGIIYGQQAFGLSQNLNIDIRDAARFIEAYFDRYRKVKEYMEESKAIAHRTGMAVTMTGRQRPLPEINSKNPVLRMAAERLAINTPLQGTQADIIKLAMVEIDRKMRNNSHLGKMILQIHDELLFETADTQLENLEKIVRPVMENVFKLNVPLVVDIKIGKNWAEC